MRVVNLGLCVWKNKIIVFIGTCQKWSGCHFLYWTVYSLAWPSFRGCTLRSQPTSRHISYATNSELENHRLTRALVFSFFLLLFFSSFFHLNPTSPNLRHSKDVLFLLRQQMASHHFPKCPGTRRCLTEAVITPQRKTTRDDSQTEKWQGWQRHLMGASASHTKSRNKIKITIATLKQREHFTQCSCLLGKTSAKIAFN